MASSRTTDYIRENNVENDCRNQTTGGCADATGYPQEGTAPATQAEPIDYREKLRAAAEAPWAYDNYAKPKEQADGRLRQWNAEGAATKPGLLYKYPNGGALTEDKKAPRTFGTGATRNSDAGKPDYEGFISPIVVHRFGQYMHKHRRMEDGSLRDSDNWQKGIPRKQYLKSMLRHVMDVWLIMRGKAQYAVEMRLEEALCAVKFNVDGLLHEVLVGRDGGGPCGINSLASVSNSLAQGSLGKGGFGE